MNPIIKEGQDNLRCELTDAEKIEYGGIVSQSLLNRLTAEDELKSFQTASKNKMTILDATIKSISEKIRNGYEFRYVEIEIETNFTECLVKFIRKDTGEIYKQRPLNSEERQLMMEVPKKEEVKECQ
jgi:uncharacterized FlaG/YvyC family protein